MAEPQNIDMFGDAMTCDPADLVARGGAAARDTSKWPQRMVELFDIQYHYNIKTLGQDEEAAAKDAAERVVLIAGYLGGRMLYLPRGDELRRHLRNSTMFKLAGRLSHAQLATAYRLTERQVYDILEEQTRLFRDRFQGKLFE